MKAGRVQFNSPNTRRYIKQSYYDYDCFAQCMYGLRYVNYKNARLLQKISEVHVGIHFMDAIKLLNMAYAFTTYSWDLIPANRVGLYNNSSFYDLLEPNQGTLGFLESSNEELSHYIVVYRKDRHIMVRDPQSDFNGFINNYISIYPANKYYKLYILYNLPNVSIQDYGVKRQHICELFSCDIIEYADQFLKHKHKKTQKTYNENEYDYNSRWNLNI
jgi:hypothetical protein